MNSQEEFPSKSVTIDEDGFPMFGEVRVTDKEIGFELLQNIFLASNGSFQTKLDGELYLVEAFDAPYMAQMVTAPDEHSKSWHLLLPYQFDVEFDLKTLTLDEWDRFHGLTQDGIPFVFSRKAQAHFFSLLDEYDDDSFTFAGVKYETTPWLESKVPVNQEKFWTSIYQNEKPRWDLGQPTPALTDMLPRIKMPKSRVLVLGCGTGHDAAFFAKAGHVVTAVDISPEAISAARNNYGDLSNLTFLEKDFFTLDHEWNNQFDLVFEHTCYCAISPNRRNELVALWKRLLAPTGYVLGIFFSMERTGQPPFGGSEWELRERLKKHFQFVFWGRVKNSIDRRNGKELLVYAQVKKS